MNASDSIKFFLPEIFLLAGAFFILLLDLFVKNKKPLGFLALLVLGGTALLARTPTVSYSLFSGCFTLDSFTHFFRLTALGIVAVTILISIGYQALPARYEGEYYSLFLFAAFGLILMATATNLLMIFLAVEFVSLTSYLLVGFLKKDARAKEAAIKYLLFGGLASGIMLYGMSLVFGATGSLELGTIQRNLANNHAFLTLSILSVLFFLVGLGFKISMVPFHMWAPDVYEAAPTPVTAFLTVGPKALGFAILIRVLSTAFSGIEWKWSFLIMVLSILTMTVGNVLAVAQTNIKRLLAYSSIAQAGYILMGLAVFSDTGLTAILIYLLAYAFTNLGAFAVVIAASNHFKNDELASYAGLAKKSPFLAAMLTFFLLSLAGIPPLGGFIAKFFVFSSAMEEGFFTLAIAAAINSAIAAFYYFKVVRFMYLTPPATEETISHPAPLTWALWLMMIGVLAMGLAPSPFIAYIKGILLL